MIRNFLAGLFAAALATAALAQPLVQPPGGSSSGSGTVTSVACPSATITSSGACKPLTAAGTSGDVITGDGASGVQDSGTALTALAPKASPTFTGTVTTPLTGGGTQCATVSNTGVLSGTGSACGSASGAAISGTPTATHCASWLNATTVQDAGATCAGATYAHSSCAPAVYTTTTTASFVMAGWGLTTCSLTPSASGTVQIRLNVNVNCNAATAAADGIILQLSYGTGTAPSANAALTGTQVGAQVKFEPGVVINNNGSFLMATNATISGLTPGTAYWFDVAVEGVTATGYTTGGATRTALVMDEVP